MEIVMEYAVALALWLAGYYVFYVRPRKRLDKQLKEIDQANSDNGTKWGGWE